MAQLYPVAGCKIYIGAAMDDQDDDFVEADFDEVTWVEVKGWTQMGAFGDSGQLITSEQINVGRTKKAKGTFNAGQMQNVFDIIPDDPGQLALIAASRTRDNYPIRIVLNDAPVVGTAPKPGERLFLALVMGAPEQGGGANTVRGLNATLEINSNFVKIAPTAGA